MIKRFNQWFFKPTSHIQIRYNTKNNGNGLVWRIIVDGEEHLATDVAIRGYAYGETSHVDGEAKLNIACDGHIQWIGTFAEITTGRGPDLIS